MQRDAGWLFKQVSVYEEADWKQDALRARQLVDLCICKLRVIVVFMFCELQYACSGSEGS